MAGLEVVVRPIVFPDIRPRFRPALPAEDDPTKGFAVISGNPAGSTSSSYSFSMSASYTRPSEKERRVDDVRVSQKNDDGTVNADNFVDLQVANKITMEEPAGDGDPGGEDPNGGGDQVGDDPSGEDGGGSVNKDYFYKRVQEEDNIVIKRRDVIVKVED